MTATAPKLVVQVVDDAPDALGFLVDALEAAGYGVLVARSGEAALQSLGYRPTPDRTYPSFEALTR